MADSLVRLARNPAARAVVNTLGLPVPMPRTLDRATGPWEERPLQDQSVVVHHASGSGVTAQVARCLTAAGADPVLVGPEGTAAYEEAGQAHGRPPERVELGVGDEGKKPYALVCDVTGLEGPEGLRALYDFYHPWIRQVAPCGRVVVVGRAPGTASTPAQAAAREALEGFIRSAGREVGRRGANALLITVDEGAEERLEPVLRFALSKRSAFVSGQSVAVSSVATGDVESRWTRALDGKKVLVTGAARGIGAATARCLAAEGAHVVVLDRPQDEELGRKVADEVSGSFLGLDVSAPDAATALSEAVVAQHGGLDVVVHNAGITRDKTLGRMSPEWWDQAVGVNLSAVVTLTDGLLASGLNDGGRIICLSSIAGIAGNVGQTNYAASKSGVLGYIRALAPHVAARGITVNAIAPGFIETRLTQAIPVMTREAARRMSSLLQGGVPQDIAEVVTFLASPGSQGLTGVGLRVCGGHLTGR